MDGSDAGDVKPHGPIALTAAGLARRQATLDLEATARMPQLFARKRARMGRSAHAFFRGCSPLFHELLGARPEQLPTPEGHGHIVGDMHLENVGAYRGESGAVVFDLNDFDDAATGPWWADVLRLTVSTLLAARALRRSGTDALRAGEAMTSGWRAGVEGDAAGVLPREMHRLGQLAAISGPPSFVGRRLFPQEDKLAVDGGVESVEEVARQVGWRLGRANRRGAREAPARPWSDRDLSGILDEAVELAGLFESIYLAHCRDAARSP